MGKISVVVLKAGYLGGTRRRFNMKIFRSQSIFAIALWSVKAIHQYHEFAVNPGSGRD